MLEERDIDLQMMTTNLTEGMPYRLPFEGRTFTFCTECFSLLFPPDVVTHMVEHAGGRQPGDLDDDGGYVGTGEDLSIRELSELVKDVVGFEGEICFNSDYPDGCK